MTNPFSPNARGLVVVKMLKSYGSNVAGETAGFLPDIAKALVKSGVAALPGAERAIAASAAEQGGAEMTSRKFRPAKEPAEPADEVVAGSATDALRTEFKELSGNDADARWGAARLAAEVAKLKDARPDDAANGE